jgi:hypothetical protein
MVAHLAEVESDFVVEVEPVSSKIEPVSDTKTHTLKMRDRRLARKIEATARANEEVPQQRLAIVSLAYGNNARFF